MSLTPEPIRSDWASSAALTTWHQSLRLRRKVSFARREKAQISASLGRILEAKLLGLTPESTPAWLASVAIPAQSARRLQSLALPPPAPPLCTLAQLRLTLQLDPLESAIFNLFLSDLLTTPAPAANVSLSQVAAEALTSATSGPMREQLRYLWSRPPGDFSPEIAALPPIRVPAPSPEYVEFADPPSRLQLTSDKIVAADWQRLLRLRQDHRQARAELNELQPQLARLLASQRDVLALPGRSSRFRAWLRQVGIPRASAYRLLRQYAPPEAAEKAPSAKETNDLNGLGVAPRAMPQAVRRPIEATLFPRKLIIRLTPQHAAITRIALVGLLGSQNATTAHPFGGSTTFRPARLIATTLATYLPATLKTRLDALWTYPPTAFARFFPLSVPPLAHAASA